MAMRDVTPTQAKAALELLRPLAEPARAVVSPSPESNPIDIDTIRAAKEMPTTLRAAGEASDEWEAIARKLTELYPDE
jgi:hypothetical protein